MRRYYIELDCVDNDSDDFEGAIREMQKGGAIVWVTGGSLNGHLMIRVEGTIKEMLCALAEYERESSGAVNIENVSRHLMNLNEIKD